MIESHDSLRELFDVGFVIIRDAINREQLRKLGETYDLMVASARPPDLSIGRTTTRVSNIANYTSDFHQLCVYRPILDACSYVIRQPFRVRCMLELCDHIPALSHFTPILKPTQMGGRCWGLSSCSTTFERTTAQRVLYRAPIAGPARHKMPRLTPSQRTTRSLLRVVLRDL